MSKFLILGGSGFIGTNLVAALLNQNEIVLNLDISSPKIQEHHSHWKQCDICDYSTLENYILAFQPDYVIHLAARTDLRGKSMESYQANTDGVLNLLDVLDKVTTLKRVIFTSSMYVCQPGYTPKDSNDYHPHTIYGESKVTTEKYIKSKNPGYPWAIIRPTSIWGPYFGEPYYNFFNIVLSKKYFHFQSRACRKTYGYVENTIFQLLSLLDCTLDNFQGNVFYLGDYEQYDIKEWADQIAAINSIKIMSVPFSLFKIAAWGGDLLSYFGVPFPMTSFRLKNMITDNIFDLSMIKEISPILPISRLEGTKKTIDWIKSNSPKN